MASTIPYDPSLTLGNIVHPERLQRLQEIQAEQSPIDEAQNALNQLILLRRSLDMTRQELVNINVPTKTLDDKLGDINKNILKAAEDYVNVAIRQQPKITDLRKGLEKIGADYESPIDYVRSQLKDVPLAADSIRMNAQYFSFSQSSQQDDSTMAQLKAFVSAETSFLGNTRSGQMASEAQSQTNRQREYHTIDGTLVITATCTHKMTSLWAPFIVDVDKAIRVWNTMRLKPFIDTKSAASMQNIALQEASDKEEALKLLSGVTLGSSFVGMVHVLNQSSTQTEQKMFAAANALQGQMKVGGWFASAQGGFGVSSSFANSAKSLLSQQSISSHVSLVCMGVIPTIVSNDVELAVKRFSAFDPEEMMGKLATLQNATADGQKSVQAASDAARTGQAMVSLEASKIASVMSAVSEHQLGTNKMLDINSLMQAFTDFVAKAAEGKSGVPINYYIKPITASQLAQMWIAKYLPGKYLTSAGDDSASGGA